MRVTFFDVHSLSTEHQNDEIPLFYDQRQMTPVLAGRAACRHMPRKMMMVYYSGDTRRRCRMSHSFRFSVQQRKRQHAAHRGPLLITRAE